LVQRQGYHFFSSFLSLFFGGFVAVGRGAGREVLFSLRGSGAMRSAGCGRSRGAGAWIRSS
jgi:hypothetical protein